MAEQKPSGAKMENKKDWPVNTRVEQKSSSNNESELAKALKFMDDYGHAEDLKYLVTNWLEENKPKKPVVINAEEVAKTMVHDVHDECNQWEVLGTDEKQYMMNMAISVIHQFGLEADRKYYDLEG